MIYVFFFLLKLSTSFSLDQFFGKDKSPIKHSYTCRKKIRPGQMDSFSFRNRVYDIFLVIIFFIDNNHFTKSDNGR